MQTGSHVTRQKLIMVLLAVLWTSLAVRIGIIQLLDHDQWYDSAQKQRKKTVTVKGARGGIYDRNGIQLAINIESASYGIRSKNIEDIDEAVDKLSEATYINSSRLRKVLTSKNGFQWLVRQPESSVMEKLDAINLGCIEKIPELKRYYPLGKIAAQVIGYTDIDGNGIEGCEFFFNDKLSGCDGRSTVFIDARHKVTPSFEKPIIESRDGLDIVLTIDWRIQEIAEEELEEGIARWNADSGGVIVLDTDTGEIIAMANVPRFDPNDTAFFSSEDFNPGFCKNRLVTDMIEPGSTFKIVTFIEGLESGVISENDEIDCQNGKLQIGRHTVNDTHKLGIVPVSEVLIHSSNIGTIKIAEKIGKQKLYERARLLGFSEVTGFDFPDETPGKLSNPDQWSKLSLPTISFGQGVAASPLQISMAYAAVANGGFLLSPRITREKKRDVGRPVPTIKEKKIRRTMKPETAERITALLRRVVEEGGGKSAAIPNVCIAGKTGTAQRIKEGVKGYIPGLYISSFVGFVTDREPKILCYVMVDSPKEVYYGSQVAAPIFKNIMNRILNLGENPWTDIVAEKKESKSSTKTAILPDMKGINVSDALKKLQEIGLNPVLVGDSTVVAKQFPLSGADLNIGTDVTLYSTMITGEKNRVRVPNLKGKSMRDAVQHLVHSNLGVIIKGSGIVTSQDPMAGTLVKYGTTCTIACYKK